MKYNPKNFINSSKLVRWTSDIYGLHAPLDDKVMSSGVFRFFLLKIDK